MKQLLHKWKQTAWVLLFLLTSVLGWGQNTAIYTVASTNLVTPSGTAPSGSNATYSQTYNTSKQLTKDNSATLTLSGYAGYKITNIVLEMRSNSSAGSGTLSVVAGSTSISSISPAAAFNTSSWYGAWSTSYVSVTKNPTPYSIANGENVVITIAATVNSLYIQKYSITYEQVSTNDTTSKVESPTTQVSTVDLASTATASGSAVDVFKFKVSDLGSGDSLPTKVTQVKIKKASGTADWTDHIGGVSLWDGANPITIGTPTITDADITIPITSGNLDISDASSKEITLKMWLKTSNIVDNATMAFTVSQTGHGFTSDASGSSFATDFGAAVTSNTVTVRATATQLVFTTQPSSTVCPSTNLATAPVVKAVDANGTVDLDYTSQITLTNSGALGMTGNQVSAVQGVATFTNLQFTQLGTVTLNATAIGLPDSSASNSVTISLANVTSFNLNPGNLQITASWINPVCFDEILIVAKESSSVTSSPTGDGTLYNANLSFGSGDPFDGGFVVYKGTTSPQIITGLNNGTTYFVKIFTREGTIWSTGVETSVVPNLIDNTKITWINTSNANAWYTSGNWSPSKTYAQWQTTDVALFENAGSATVAGINMGTSSLAIAGIEISNLRTRELAIGNNSSTARTLTLNGGIINGNLNTILRNNSGFSLTLQNNVQNSSTANLIFNNSINNNIMVDGSGGIVITSSITSALGPVTISGSGSGTVVFSGQNTYTTATNVNSSTLRLNRTGGTTIPSSNPVTVDGGTLQISTNQTLSNLTLTSGSLIVDANATLTLNQNITIPNGFTITNNGTIVIQDTLTDNRSDKTFGGTVSFNGSSQQTIAAETTFSNLTINNTAGVKASGDITVNGVLNLASANPNATDGALDMVIAYGTYATVSKSEPDNYNSTLPHNNLNSYVLNLGAAATVTGIGDVTGKVTREHPFVSGTTYAFSHPNMTLSFTDLGTLGNLPSRITVIATRGAEGLHVDKDAADNGNPAIGGPAVQRLWQILRGGTQIGSAEDRFSVKFPYTDLELNDNTEGDLVTWDHHLENPAYDGVTPHEHGKTNNNTTDNFVELANHGMFYLAEEGSVSRTKYWMLSNKVSTYDSVWLGAVDIPFLSTTNWNIASNWTGGNIPDATDNVYIPDASTTPHDPVISEGSILIDQLLGSLLGNVGMKTLEIGTGGVLTVASGTNPTLTIFGGPNSSGGGNNFGSWINNGTFVPANSKVVFNSSLTASGATIAGTTQFHDLSILLNETVTIQEDAEISIKGKFINLGTLNATTDANTFVFNGTTNQTIPATSSDNNTAAYHHLELSGSGAKSFEGTPSIQGNLIKSGTSSVVIPSQFNFNGATAQSIAGFDYNNIEFSGTGIKTFTSNGSLSNAGAITFSGTPGAVDFDGATDNLTFVLKSDASGTARIGNATDWALNGKVTAERYVPAKRSWRLLTAPSKGSSNNSIFANWQGTANEGILLWNPNGGGATGLEVGPQSNIFSYNGGWAAVNNTNTTPLFGATQNNAFLVFATGPHGSANITPGADPTTPATATTLRPKGGLITGTVTTTLTANQFQLIGNPYASALDTEALIGSNPDAKIWMLDPTLGSFGGYVTYDGTNWAPSTPVAADKNIQSGQAFFVRSTSTLFSIGETHKVISSSNNWFERDNSASTADKIRVLLYKQESGNWKLADGVLSVHSSVGNDAVDAADANKISNFNENIAFRNGATNLAIEYRGMPEAGTQQPLRMTGTTAQPYQLRVRTEGYVNSTLQPYLEDTASGTLTAIPTDGSDLIVSFTGIVATTSTPDNRFRIVYPTTLGVDDIMALPVSVYPNPVTEGAFTVVLKETTAAQYALVNVLGQEVQKGTLSSLHNTIPVGTLQHGIYVLQVRQEGKVFTTKLILK